MRSQPSDYLEGWRYGSLMVHRNVYLPRVMLQTARLLLAAQAGLSEYSRGWADAILSGYGA